MIVSASRRTDIPAFYSEWFMNRVRDGYCLVPNPFNAKQVSRISLRPEDVDALVFWTRDARPLLPHLAELDARGLRYCFLYTIVNNPREIDPGTPPLDVSVEAFGRVADHVGPERIHWRYDPIVLSNLTGPSFHARNHGLIARALRGHTRRNIVSFLRVYRKSERRLAGLAKMGIELDRSMDFPAGGFPANLAATAKECGMTITSCAERADLRPFGIQPGSCIDGAHLSRVFGLDLPPEKDPGQRRECRCSVSRDIGMYDTCLFGCKYCYATQSMERAGRNHARHDPESPCLTDRPPELPPMDSRRA